ncbi:tyrosine-type recombinase/integrase [Tessaracoccus sp. HDW20]|nr:tyrosine-type recombinase/integrase [Tessaracoccus coleopterorum]
MKPVPSLWAGPLAMWRRSLVAAGRSPETIATRTDHLRRAARALGGDPRDVTAGDVVEWAGVQVWSRETRRSVYASLRGFWRWALTQGLVVVDATAQLPRVAPTPPMPRPAPDEVIAAAARDQHDRRLALIVLCAAELGMRRAEIAQVNASDLSRDLLGWTLRVHGKGGKDRDVPLTDDQASTLRLACRAGWMLPGRINGHLSARRVGELATEALAGHWTAHTLRHRAATTVYAATGDLVAVQQMLGHASVATTQRYVALPSARLRSAVATAARSA